MQITEDHSLDWIGRTIGRYRIEATIGQGGTAVVYRAFQPLLERWVAVKILKTRSVANRKFLTRFQQEAKAIAQLRHPNILTVYEYGEEEGMPYIVMEYVPGGTLQEKLSGAPLSWRETAELIIPIARSLAYAHDQNMVHCDVKPGNILLARPDWTLLADFGLARLQSLTPNQISQDSISGTPLYLSPEQLIGNPLDGRSDLYGLSIIIYQMLTGKLPFDGQSAAEIMMNRLNQNPTPPSIYNERISVKLETAVLRAMSRRPADRYQKVDDFIDDLLAAPESLIESEELHSSTTVFSTTALTLESPRQPNKGPCLITSGTGTPLPIPQKEDVLLGRADPRLDENPDMDLGPHGGDVAGVSRQHAKLRHSPEGWLLQDLYSTNGTFINGIRITPHIPVRLRSGDMIRCGRLKLLFKG